MPLKIVYLAECLVLGLCLGRILLQVLHFHSVSKNLHLQQGDGQLKNAAEFLRSGVKFTGPASNIIVPAARLKETSGPQRKSAPSPQQQPSLRPAATGRAAGSGSQQGLPELRGGNNAAGQRSSGRREQPSNKADIAGQRHAGSAAHVTASAGPPAARNLARKRQACLPGIQINTGVL